MVVIILITLLILILIYNFYSNINNNELYENIQSEECNVEVSVVGYNNLVDNSCINNINNV